MFAVTKPKAPFRKTKTRSYRLSPAALEKLEKLHTVWEVPLATVLSLAVEHLYSDWSEGRVHGLRTTLVTEQTSEQRNEKSDHVKPPVSVSR